MESAQLAYVAHVASAFRKDPSGNIVNAVREDAPGNYPVLSAARKLAARSRAAGMYET